MFCGLISNFWPFPFDEIQLAPTSLKSEFHVTLYSNDHSFSNFYGQKKRSNSYMKVYFFVIYEVQIKCNTTSICKFLDLFFFRSFLLTFCWIMLPGISVPIWWSEQRKCYHYPYLCFWLKCTYIIYSRMTFADKLYPDCICAVP